MVTMLGARMKAFFYLMHRNIFFKAIFIGIFLFEFADTTHLLVGQTKVSPENDDAEQSHYNQLIEQIRKVDYATQCAQNAVKAFADSVFLPELLFQLSEWEIQKEKLYYEMAMIKYDRQLKLFDSGKLKIEPTEPSLTYEKALNINRQILTKFPNYEHFNRILYRTGLCLFETGKRDSSKEIFLKVINEYPDSTYQADVLFRLGECYFDEGNYQKAIEMYQPILANWKTPFFAMALYKLAWCYYRLNNYSAAISSFYYLLNDIKLVSEINSEMLGKSQVQLKDEIMEYITLSFSDFGGANSLYNFVERMGGSAYTPNLLYKLGSIYIKRDFNEDGIETLNLLINKFPYYEKLPEIFLLFFQCFESMGDMNKAYMLHDQLIQYCRPQSKWSQ